jgi:hypothetical protein
MASELEVGSLITTGNVGVGDSTPSSPGGVARFLEISGSSASLVLTDSDAATWEWISAGGNLKAAKDGSDYLSIDSSGNVTVDGGGYLKIAPANTTAGLRLYRNDATINTSGIAIGDINFGGADANNDNAARLRVKSDGAWTSTSSPTAFEFQTCPSGSESPQTRLVIGSTGLATFSNGISNERGIYGGTLSVADDAVGEITPPRQATFMTLSYNATSDYPSHWGALLYIDVGLSIVSNVVAGPSSAIESVNSDVTGTTGTDTKTTVGGTLATGSGQIGKIRIENRHGTSVTYNYNFFG